MADFWIKIEKSTPDKPEVFEIASILNIDPDAVLGKLVRAWAWIDSNSENGHVSSVTNVLIDRVTSCAGFAEAMRSVGWLQNESVPNFDRHMGKSAKKRANDAERKRKSRKTSEECHAKVVTEKGLDKSRVDKINNNKRIDQNEFDRMFEKFWSSGIRKTGKKKAHSLFCNILKKQKDQNTFTDQLIKDVQYRLDNDQLGFSEMHPSTYLNGERWNDERRPKQQNQSVYRSIASESERQTRIILAQCEAEEANNGFMGSNGAALSASLDQSGGREVGEQPIDAEFYSMVQENGGLD